MKLKFDPALEYQRHAIEAVADLFNGQPLGQGSFEISGTLPSGLSMTEHGVGNNLVLSDEQLLANVVAIQERNNIEKVSELAGRDFSIEMETGTGKTYVYLRTILELNKRYGLKKFIIVVPSVAIREGVLKSLEITREHFKALFDNMAFGSFVYDSKRLGDVRQFANSNHVQIMVINIQAFQRDIGDDDSEAESAKANVIYRDNDKMGGKPIEFIQSTKPIVIIDEPQSVDNTAKSKRAIEQLSPCVTLRYSATHKTRYNLLYQLGPIEAYDMRLVKRIEVASIRADEDFSNGYVKLLDTRNKNGIKAQVEFYKLGTNGPKTTKAWVKQGDDLFRLSGEHHAYAQGFVVRNIDSTPGMEMVEFNRGQTLALGQEQGGNSDEVMRAMVRETVEQHLRKEKALQDKGIKVLSLFFIDKVSSYRVYNDDGSHSLGKIGQWFEECLAELTALPRHQGLLTHPVEQLHNGYFSQDKKGRAKDTTGKTKDDEDTYSLIMRDKERLLNPDEPLRFIFSHTALREGWDNPNVFQICTLREVGSELERRQQIGRGLRLPVNKHGERVHDEHLNRLTVVAGERYEDFAAALQNEYKNAHGIEFGRVKPHAFAKLLRPTADGTDEVAIGQDSSARLWEELVQQGHLDQNGELQPTFQPDNLLFKLELSEEFAPLTNAVIDTIQEYDHKNRVKDARKKGQVSFNKRVHLSEDFAALWSRISQRTRFRVKFDTAKLVEHAASRIKAMPKVEALSLSMSRVDVEFSKAGVSAERQLEQLKSSLVSPAKLPDLLGFLQKETELTRDTLITILRKANRTSEFLDNPQAFMAQVAREIGLALHELMLEGITYEKIEDEHWQMQRFESDENKTIERYLNNLYEVRNSDKALYDQIEIDSAVERQFAKDLDNNENVRLFVKLPDWFKIDTPIGPYNPDWAFVTERDEKLYFVRETKSTTNKDELRESENHKIHCGQAHFDALGTNFGVVTNLNEVTI